MIDSSNACNQVSAPIVYKPRDCMGRSSSQFIWCYRLVGHMFPQELPLSLRGSSPSRNTPLYSGGLAKPTYHRKRHFDQFCRFCVGRKCYAVQFIVSGEETPQNCPFPMRFCHSAGEGLSHGHRQHAQKLIKIASVLRRTDRQADRHTDVLITILRRHLIICRCEMNGSLLYVLLQQTCTATEACGSPDTEAWRSSCRSP